MIYLEYLLWSYLIVWPVYIYLTFEQEKQSVILQQEERVSIYRLTMLQMWIPTLILLALVFSNHVSAEDIGLQWHWNLANQIAVVGLLLLSGYAFFSIKQLKQQPENHAALRKQYADMEWFLPATVRESRYFIFGLSLSAGVCEELLYRGYLMQLLADDFPTYATVILSSLAFGLGHIYQGAIHVLRTAVLGAAMALIYLATDSIIAPIILHALIDMQGGVMSYVIFSDKEPQTIIGENT